MIHPLFLNKKEKDFLWECKRIFGRQCGLDLIDEEETEICTGCWLVNSSQLNRLRLIVGGIRSIATIDGNLSIFVTLPTVINRAVPIT